MLIRTEPPAPHRQSPMTPSWNGAIQRLLHRTTQTPSRNCAGLNDGGRKARGNGYAPHEGGIVSDCRCGPIDRLDAAEGMAPRQCRTVLGLIHETQQFGDRWQPPDLPAADVFVDIRICRFSPRYPRSSCYGFLPHQPRLAVQDRLVVEINQYDESLGRVWDDVTPGFQVGLPDGIINRVRRPCAHGREKD